MRRARPRGVVGIRRRTRRNALLVVSLLAATACAAPERPVASPTRAPTLGVAATIVESPPPPGSMPATSTPTPPAPTPPAPTGAATASPDRSTPTTAGRTTPTTAGAASSGPLPPSPSPPLPRFRTVGAASDAARDQGLEAPAYADLRRVTIEDDGEHARATLEVGGPLPTSPADGEVIGIGVDLLRRDGGESTYQLYADGGADGWFAYLQTPDGFVAYPGSLRVDGATITFVVPWRAVGTPLDGPFRGFVDWSRTRPIRNAAAEDRAPDATDATFDRS